jgi:hypothetical protein
MLKINTRVAKVECKRQTEGVITPTAAGALWIPDKRNTFIL